MGKARKITDPKISREKTDNFKAMQWVMNNLSDKEISAMDSQQFDGERFAEFMERLIDGGFDVKISWDTYSDAYQVSAMGVWKNFPNQDVACSARGLDVFDAWKILWFKIDFVANWDLQQFVGDEKVKSRRG